MNILVVGIGGFIGAICRFLLNEWMSSGSGFPMATLIANWLGSFLLAFILTTASVRLQPQVKLAITTGFFGAFTTFSTFSLEAFQLLERGAILLGIGYILVSILGGLSFSFLGFYLAQRGRSL